jgi:hypothetical protein
VKVIDRHAGKPRSSEADAVSQPDVAVAVSLELAPLPLMLAALVLFDHLEWLRVPLALLAVALFIIGVVCSGVGWLILGDWQAAILWFMLRLITVFLAAAWEGFGLLWIASLFVVPVASAVLLARKWWPLAGIVAPP